MRTFLLGVLTVVFLAACGGSDDDAFEESTELEALEVEDRSLDLGDSTIVSARFSYSEEDVFFDGERVYLVIELPQSVQLREGTAELQSDFEDQRVTPAGIICSSGRILLFFDFDDNDLANVDDPDGDADAELRFTIDVVSREQTALIRGVSSSAPLPIGCDNDFFPEQVVSISVN